jgi:hypothetical protein
MNRVEIAKHLPLVMTAIGGLGVGGVIKTILDHRAADRRIGGSADRRIGGSADDAHRDDVAYRNPDEATGGGIQLSSLGKRGPSMTSRDLFLLWLGAYAAALSASAARLGLQLAAGDPPEDPAGLRRWKRRRAWLIGAEMSALPMFATLAVLAAAQGWCSPVAAVCLALVSGALGFAFFIHALEAIVRRQLKLPEAGL